MDVREYTERFPSALPAKREVAHHAWVSVSVGCDNTCSFCIVPLVRGPQRSRPLGEILAEVQGLAGQGVIEVTLLGQNVNTYGRDVTIPGHPPRPLFGALLRAVNDVDGIRRIRFTSPHPHHFSPDVVEAMADCERVCEHIHFPLQSGSDRVLGLMRRSYRASRYLEWLERIRDAVPGIAVTTDIIVGFPGETEDDFLGTLEVVERAGFDAAYTFQYSPRPGTVAAEMDEQLPKEVVQERFDRLLAVQEAISLRKNEEMLGRTVEVLVEGSGRKGGVQGRTRTNKVVNFTGTQRPGELVDVVITGAHPHHLTGELARVAAHAG
jgi:tRNA-2-methylthio-N6-dimethylallyladenosine synthase